MLFVQSFLQTVQRYGKKSFGQESEFPLALWDDKKRRYIVQSFLQTVQRYGKKSFEQESEFPLTLWDDEKRRYIVQSFSQTVQRYGKKSFGQESEFFDVPPLCEFKVTRIQSVVCSFLSDEFFVVTTFYDFTFVKNHYYVGIADS